MYSPRKPNRSRYWDPSGVFGEMKMMSTRGWCLLRWCAPAARLAGWLAVAQGGVWCHITSACCESSAFAVILSWEHLSQEQEAAPDNLRQEDASEAQLRKPAQLNFLSSFPFSTAATFWLFPPFCSYVVVVVIVVVSDRAAVCLSGSGALRKAASKFSRHVSQEGCQRQRRQQQQPLCGQPRRERTRQRSEGQPGDRAHERRGPSQQTVRQQQQRVLRHRFQGEHFVSH